MNGLGRFKFVDRASLNQEINKKAFGKVSMSQFYLEFRFRLQASDPALFKKSVLIDILIVESTKTIVESEGKFHDLEIQFMKGLFGNP